MSALQNKAGPISVIKIPVKNGNIRDGNGSKIVNKNKLNIKSIVNGAVDWCDNSINNEYKEVIRKADTVNIIQVFKYYGITMDLYSKTIQCPFKFHKDNSPSFQFYPETNSFHCWGCKNSGMAVQLVSLIEGISRIDAANKLLFNFESSEINNDFLTKSSEVNDLYLKFSFGIRNFLNKNKSNKAMDFADLIASSFDSIVQKHTIDDINGLKHMIEKLLGKLEKF